MPVSVNMSTKNTPGQGTKQIQQVVHGSSSWRVGAELLAETNQRQGGEQ